VKVQSEDPKKEDPYAMLSVLNMQEHKVKKKYIYIWILQFNNLIK